MCGMPLSTVLYFRHSTEQSLPAAKLKYHFRLGFGERIDP